MRNSWQMRSPWLTFSWRSRSSLLMATSEKKWRQQWSKAALISVSRAGEYWWQLKMSVVKRIQCIFYFSSSRRLNILKPKSLASNSRYCLARLEGMLTGGVRPSLGKKFSVTHTTTPSWPYQNTIISPHSVRSMRQTSLSSSIDTLLARSWRIRKYPSSTTPSSQSPSVSLRCYASCRREWASKQLSVRWMWLWKSSQMERQASSDSLKASKLPLWLRKMMNFAGNAAVSSRSALPRTLWRQASEGAKTMQLSIYRKIAWVMCGRRGCQRMMQLKITVRDALPRERKTEAVPGER